MGLYNILITSVNCPNCKNQSEVGAELKIGYLNLKEYRVGDKIEWAEGFAKWPHQKRTNNGNFIGDGYIECPHCGFEYLILITVGIHQESICLTESIS